MDRQEINKETKDTKNIKNILFWIVGIGIVLAIIAVVGGVFNHDGDVTPKTDQTGTMMSDTIAGDRMSDTLATDMQR